jgi:hypothetical protein
MTPRFLVPVVVLLLAAPALAQGPHGRQRDPGSAAQGGGYAGPRQAVPRNDPPPPPPPAAAPAPAPRSSATAPDEGGRAVPRERAPRDAGRRAVPRTGPVPPLDRDGRIRRPGSYRYSYPRYLYPYGYGGFGLGYFYYDPYYWGPAYGGYYDPYYYGSGGYYGGYYGGYADTGELRLEVKPRDAEVYVDGYYAGRVDDFDGIFQALKIPEGPHAIRIVAPGYEPLDFSINVYAGRKISYRGELLPRRP